MISSMMHDLIYRPGHYRLHTCISNVLYIVYVLSLNHSCYCTAEAYSVPNSLLCYSNVSLTPFYE